MEFSETVNSYDLVLDMETLDFMTEGSIEKACREAIDLPSNATPFQPNHDINQDVSFRISKISAPIIHVLQFCHLCSHRKIPAVHYKLTSSQESKKSFIYTMASCKWITSRFKHQIPLDNINSDSNNYVASPDHKICLHLLKTIIEINNNMGKQ
jgi:hypothetical protein